MDIDLRPSMGQDYFSEDTKVCRMSCETRLLGIFVKYNVSKSNASVVVDGIADYLDHALRDLYKKTRH